MAFPVVDSNGHVVHILIDNKPFLIRQGTYFKTQQPFASIPQFGKPVDLSPVKKWTQSSWKGGLGQRRMADAEMYDDGQVDSYSDTTVLQTPPQLSSIGHANPQTNFFDLWAANTAFVFEVRATDDAHNAALYFLMSTSGGNAFEIWKLTQTGGTLTRIGVMTSFQADAIINSFHDDPHNLMIGGFSPSGELFRVTGGTDTLNATPLNNNSTGGGVFNQPRVLCFANYNDADYIGIGAASQGAKVYRMTSGSSWAISLFKDIDCHAVLDMKTWNGRLWILAVLRNRETRVYVTDGNVVNLAYKWSNAFYGRKMFEFGGSLYIAGGRYSYDETLSIGQVYRYNGSTIDLIGQFDDTGLTDNPVWTNTVVADVRAMGSWGKFLAVGMNNRNHLDGQSHRGIWLYDPAQDAWHQGTYKDASDTVHSGNFSLATNVITDLREFDGALYLGMQDGAGLLWYLKNSRTNFIKGMYRSSIFDAGLPQQNKLFTRLLLDLELPTNARVTAYYSTDEGVTWSAGTNFDNTGAAARGIYTLNLGPSGAGVKAKSIQLRLDIFPGNGTAPGNSVGTVSTKVHSHMVEYADAPDLLYRWQFDIAAATHSTGPDNNEDARTGEQIHSDFVTLQDGLVHTLTDVDGTTYAVFVDTGNTFRSVINPDSTSGIYSDISAVLVQVR